MREAFIQKFINRVFWNTVKPESGFPFAFSGRGVNFENPNTPINDTTVGEMFGVEKTSSGQSVNEKTALNYSAVWRCAEIISGLIASLPFKPFMKTSDGREELKDHFIYPFVTMRPTARYTKTVYLARAILHYLFWGNHIAKIIISKNGFGGFELIHPHLFKEVTENSRGDLVYIFYVDDKHSETVRIKDSGIIHVPNLGEGLWGDGVIKHAREDIGLDFAARNYGGAFFGAGGHYHDYITTDQVIPGDKLKDMKKFYDEQKKDGGTLVMTGGMKYNQQSVPPEDAQFLQTREFGIRTIARWFGVPPDKLGDLSQATQRNIEHQAISFLQDTIAPILSKFENEYTYKVMDWKSGEYLEFNMDAYVRADSQARSELYRTYIQNGLRKPNELRALDNLSGVDGGDDVYIQQNMMKLRDSEKVFSKLKPNGQEVKTI